MSYEQPLLMPVSTIIDSLSLSSYTDPSSVVCHLLLLPRLSLWLIGTYLGNSIWDVWFVGTCGAPELVAF